MAVRRKNKDEFRFEEGMRALESLLDEMEGGEMALDDVVAKYEEGVKLVKQCGEKLNEAEKKVEVLTLDAEGGFRSSKGSGGGADDANGEGGDAEEGTLF